MNLVVKKKQLRKQLKSLRKNIPNQSERSKLICDILLSDKRISESKNILLYYPIFDEVDILPVIEYCLLKKKAVFLPFTKDISIGQIKDIKDVEDYNKNFKQPTQKTLDHQNIKLDVIVMPGLGFDRSGNRIGRGMGWYDKFIGTLKHRPYLLGVCFQEQLLLDIPQEKHDIILDEIISV